MGHWSRTSGKKLKFSGPVSICYFFIGPHLINNAVSMFKLNVYQISRHDVKLNPLKTGKRRCTEETKKTIKKIRSVETEK